MLRHPDPEGYICEKFIDMMEKQPFDKIKVTEFCKFAQISRGSFYVYFDSVYSVLEKIEANFLEALVPEDQYTLERMLNGKEGGCGEVLMRDTADSLKKNFRVYRILTSENGDHSFETKILNRVRRVASKMLDSMDLGMTDVQKKLYIEHTAGGQLMTLKWMAAHEKEIDLEEIYAYSAEIVINGIRILSPEKLGK